MNDSITATLDEIKETLSQMPKESRERARHAGMHIVSVFEKMRNDYPTDPAVALGVAFAIFMIADTLIENDAENSEHGKGLIQLLQ